MKIGIPDETLQQIATPICAEKVLNFIETRKPGLRVEKIREVLKKMEREDACLVLDRNFPGVNFFILSVSS